MTGDGETSPESTTVRTAATISVDHDSANSDQFLLRLGVAMTVLVAVVLGAWARWMLGGRPITEASNGWLSADATPLRPHETASVVWIPIYLGMLAYGVWRLTPLGAKLNRSPHVEILVIAAVILNAVWLNTLQVDWLNAGVGVVTVLLAVLLWLHMKLLRTRPNSRLEAVVLDGTFGLYLGWICVSVMANATAWLNSLQLVTAETSKHFSMALLILVTLLGLALAHADKGRLSSAFGLSWGIGSVSIARTEGHHESGALVVVAAVCALAILTYACVRRILTVRGQRNATPAGSIYRVETRSEAQNEPQPS